MNESQSQLTQDEIKQVADLTEALTPIDDMADILMMPRPDLRMILNDEQDYACKIYRKARTRAFLKIRKNDIELAEAGAPNATNAVYGYLKNIKNESI